MALKKLDIVGFKSFAKKTSLTFASSITAIVGPNGSGKSNAAEAFRFVLGEQSMKSLRGKRTEDLIFNGSTKTGRSNRASVKLVFDNTHRLLDVDFDEVSVERTIHRDASSEYAINGSTVRLKDVHELLAGANIGSSGHHIISQGAADRVLSVNPRERREMIEDGLGLRVYQYKITESSKKLERTRQNIEKVESLRREIKPHITFLKKQVEKVERAQELRIALTDLYKEYFRRETLYIAHEEMRIQSARIPIREEKVLHEKEKSVVEKRLAELDAEASYSDTTVAFEKELRTIRDKKDTLARTLGRIEGTLDAEEKRLAEAETTHTEQEYIPSIEVRGVLDMISEQVLHAEKAENLEEVRTFLKTVRNTMKTFWDGLRGKENTNTGSLRETVAQLRSEKASHEQEMLDLNTKEEVVRARLIEEKHTFEKEQHESRESERRVFELREKIQMLVQRLGVLESDEERLRLIRQEYDRELMEARALVGREAVHYEEAVLQDTEGNLITPEEAVREERRVQEERKRAVEKLKIRLEEAGAGSGDDVLKEYTDVTERDAFLMREITDLEHSAESLVSLIGELNDTLDRHFKEGLAKINTAFNEFFGIMFGGGSAGLRVVTEGRKKRASDILLDDGEEKIIEEEGIEITLSLPRKKVRSLEMLSGGERALTSIALIFAMSQVNPPPFLILDETDAALDEANSRRYGDMIERLAERSQLILITHNRETMSRADVLYGVTMGGDGVSQVLSVGFTEAVQTAK